MGCVSFLEFADLEEQLLWQIRWLTGISFLLIVSVFCFWFFRRKRSASPALKFYDTYLGYYVQSYSEIHPEILQQSEKTQEQIHRLVLRLKENGNCPLFAYLCWMEGQIYRYHQPHLRLIDLLEKEKIGLSPFQEAQLRLQIEQARVFFEKSTAFFQMISDPSLLNSLTKRAELENEEVVQPPLTPVQIQRLPERLQSSLQELFQEMRELRPIFTEHTLVGEWILMIEKASERLQQKGLQCFYCSVKDFHTLAEAAHCHPFKLQEFLEASQHPLDPKKTDYSITKAPETLIVSS